LVRMIGPFLLACGSMVLSLYCVSFFAPFGAKNDTQRMKHATQAKVLFSSFVGYFSPSRAKNNLQGI
jgi:hypothetical protein